MEQTRDRRPKKPLSLMDRALRLLARRARTEAELRERLLAFAGSDENQVGDVIRRLKHLGLLNDGVFAYQTASSQLRLRPVGRARIERELKVKKVPARLARKALDEVYEETSETEQLERAIRRLLKLRGRPKSREEAKKFYDRLVRLGFPYELVWDRLRALGSQEGIDLGE